MTPSSSWLSVLLAGTVIVHAAPAPMEPAERTLFVFVHGINPKCAGSLNNATDSDSKRSLACEDGPLVGAEEPLLGPFCVDRSQLLGRAAQVWVKDLDGTRSDDALFCVLKRELFQGQYSLRSFTDPGASPVDLARELGDRGWASPENASLRSHAVEAMRRYLEHRRELATTKMNSGMMRSDFEQRLQILYNGIPIEDLKPILAVYPDSVPSRMVVLAHSMGGLTTREYLVSDFYNEDLDKVVAFDSPLKGSWVAYYNQSGVRTQWNKPAVSSATKLGFGLIMFATLNPVLDQVATLLTISGSAGGSAALLQNWGGFFGNKFKGDEKGSDYLEPGSADLTKLNNRASLACESTGCQLPKFVLYSTDGTLSPDDPSKLLGGNALRAVLPTELVDMVAAAYMTTTRDWPSTFDIGDITYLSSVAAAFAEGGWNYTQHGSLAVPQSSSRGHGIAMLDRPDANVDRREPLTYGRRNAEDAIGVQIGDRLEIGGAILAVLAIQSSSNVASAMVGTPWLGQAAKFFTTVGIGALIGAGAATKFGVYAKGYAPSHNLAVVKSASERTSVSYADALGKKVDLSPRWIENDLYEKPFVQVRWDEGMNKYAGQKILRMRSSDALNPPVRLEPAVLSPIVYTHPGWEDRWAIRKEAQIPVGDSQTLVRRVERWSLPYELVTETDIRGMDLQVDDLRPDLLEQISIAVSWGRIVLTWDRERAADGSDLGTYRLIHTESGDLVSTRTGLTNPIDNYGRWTVDFDAHLEGSVLRDGQNQIAVSLVNHVGKRSVQRQFITYKASPPLVAMSFPQPWEVVSGTQPRLRARVTLLSYPGYTIDPSRSGWGVDLGGVTRGEPFHDLLPLPGLEKGLSEIQIDELLPPNPDGFWSVTVRTSSVNATGVTSLNARGIPFYLDRSPPRLLLTGSTQPTRPGKEREFVLDWNDGVPGKHSVLELLRARILDSAGTPVAELAPVSYTVGERMVLRWNGNSSGSDTPDGRYFLKIEARDDAVPDAATRSEILDLRTKLADAANAWLGALDPMLAARWASLRTRADLNWSETLLGFRIDGSAPVAFFDPLPTKVLSREDRLQIRFRLQDPGSRDSTEALRVRFEFTPVGGTLELAHALESSHNDVVAALAQSPLRTEGERLDGLDFLLPDGSWKVSAFAEDVSGNRTRWADLGTIVVDRTAPSIRSLRTTHVMLPEGSALPGEAVLEAAGAQSVQATWVSPNGIRDPVATTLSGGLWTAPYPPDLGRTKGVWRLELVVSDPAGNATHAQTRLWVGLLSPKLAIAGAMDTGVSVVTGPVALSGIAMDPMVDLHGFVSYALQWRWKGDGLWNSEGLRVPAGRMVSGHPGTSRREQTHDGILGFWDPPQGSGTIELRLFVDDGSGETEGREAILEVYRTADEAVPFSTIAHIEPRLGTSVSTAIGMEIRASGTTSANYRAQVLLTDSRGDLLVAKDLVDLKASRFAGVPTLPVSGAFQLWHEEGLHLRANGACRSFKVRLLMEDSAATAATCPNGWLCDPKSIEPFTLPMSLGGSTFRRLLELSIPAGSSGEFVLDLKHAVQATFEGDTVTSCLVSNPSCPEGSGAGSAGLFPFSPRSGELVTGAGNLPWCEMGGNALVKPGTSSWSVEWNGIRPDGTVPAPGPATLDVVAWDPATGRIASTTATTILVPGEGKLRAWANEEVSIASDAPAVQHRAGLAFRLEGRGATLNLRILANDTVVKTLQGSGDWYEGRSGALPYAATWDGKDDSGSLVAAGTYTFEVSEPDGTLRAVAPVQVTGSSWKEDPSLSLSIPESEWDTAAGALRIKPIPELKISTGVSASLVEGGTFTYAADWSGKQLALVHPTSRFSLMVHRKRTTVKFGILFRMVLNQQVYNNKGFACGGKDGQLPIEHITGVHVVELVPGQVARIDVVGAALANGIQTKMYRMTGGPHHFEYRVVPLSEVDALNAIRLENRRWEIAVERTLNSGSFTLNDLTVSPAFGQFETRSAVGPFDWVNPSAPFRCPDSLLQRFGDLPGKGVQTSAEACGKTSQRDREFFNPHRNLIQFRALPWIDETRIQTITIHVPPAVDPVTRKPKGRGTTKTVQQSVRTLAYAHGSADAHCTRGADKDKVGVHFELMVPEAYWDAPIGLENLANRFLRFDSRNKYLYGPNGYLAHDDFDNDGVGPADDDDPGEAHGDLAAFEMRRYHWRPRLTDRLMFTKPCGSGSGNLCDSVRAWTTLHGTTDAGKVLERPQDDPLYFFEGDHGRIPETLTAWFENTPEQGNSSWSATLRQNTNSIHLGPENVGADNAKTLVVERSSAPGNVTHGLVWWTTPSVDITVRLSGSLQDLQNTSWQKPLPWPLDSLSFLREKRLVEQDCALSGIGPCRLNAAASGVRFGLDDGLNPTRSQFQSLAQQRLFEDLARGIHSPPDSLPGGFPKGSGRVVLTGELAHDASGILRHGDSIHFSHSPADIPLMDARVEPNVLEWTGGQLFSRLETLPSPRALFWSGPPAQGSWTLAKDPALRGSDRLDVPKQWNPSMSKARWSLLQIYGSVVGDPPDPDLDLSGSLFRHDGLWQRNPRLGPLSLSDPRVAFQDGSDASEAFAIVSSVDANNEEGLEVSRRPGVWGLPEWIEIRGSVPFGTTYKLGWRDLSGAWITAGAERKSICTSLQVSEGSCSLAFLDAAALPHRADIGILVGEGADRRFQTLSIVQGHVVASNQAQEVRSLFGEVAVNFPAGTLAGKSESERSISIRALDPSRSGLRLPAGMAVTGPVVEVLPSQDFSSNPLLQPQIKVRLTKADLTSLSEAPGLGLFKIDPDQGILVQLQDRGITYLCETAPCTMINAHAVEFTALTSSFSRFVLLPKSLRDSRSWDFDLEPRNGTSARREIRTVGIPVSQLVWAMDDDDTLDDEKDRTPPVTLNPVQEIGGRRFVDLPPGTHWIFAWDLSGGLAKKIPVSVLSGPFEAGMESLQPLVLGTVNGGARRRLLSNREGTWTLILQDEDRTLGFREGILRNPEGLLELPPDLMGSRWSDTVQTRLSLRARSGEVIERPGPAILGDATLPTLRLQGTVTRSPTGWVISGRASAIDREGPIARLQLSLQTQDGRVLQSLEVEGSAIDLRHELSAAGQAGTSVRLVAVAFDLGGNHAQQDTLLELHGAVSSPNRILWAEAEDLVHTRAIVPVCELESRFAVRTDRVDTLEWTLPLVAGTYHLAARWRSRQTEIVSLALQGADLGRWSLPGHPSWGDLEPLGPVLVLRGGERLQLISPKGMQWDGLALVQDSTSLPGWRPPSTTTEERAEVWIRDEGPDDPNMVHARIFVRNLGNEVLEGYRLRLRVRTEPDQVPQVSSWWPTPLATQWDRESDKIWALVLDRSRHDLQSGGSDFQGDGAALGFHLPHWEPWNRLDDPAWPGGIPATGFTKSSSIPIFDTTGALISSWQCAEELPWLPPAEADSSPVLELRSSRPLTMGARSFVEVIPEGTWAWQSTVIGLTPLDGQPMEGVLHLGDQTWPLSGWWQEIRIPNAQHQRLSIQVAPRDGRKLQIQKWEE